MIKLADQNRTTWVKSIIKILWKYAKQPQRDAEPLQSESKEKVTQTKSALKEKEWQSGAKQTLEDVKECMKQLQNYLKRPQSGTKRTKGCRLLRRHVGKVHKLPLQSAYGGRRHM